MTADRTLESCPSMVYIVYTPGPGAEERGYETWLREVDNPFFNAVPGIRHYANWKIERVMSGAPLSYGYFDFQGLDSKDDLEGVWFNADLDSFRAEWVRLWGYAGARVLPVQAQAYLMRPTKAPRGRATSFARLFGGRGVLAYDSDLAWTIEEVLTKHYALKGEGAWRRPVGSDNPLGLDWLALDYFDTIDDATAAQDPGAEIAFAARLLASPTVMES